jgi:hypothetical protein
MRGVVGIGLLAACVLALRWVSGGGSVRKPDLRRGAFWLVNLVSRSILQCIWSSKGSVEADAQVVKVGCLGM